MSQTRKAMLILTFVLSALLLAGLSAAAAGTFTVKGRVTYPDGRPAAGVELRLVAWSREGLDMGNIVWKIPNFNPHFVTTDANGDYVMTNVIDYPENLTHRYTVWTTEKTRLYHGVVNFPLEKQMPVATKDIHLENATWVTVKLKNRNGTPFNGTRAVYVQTGTNLHDPTTGVAKVQELTFVDGKAGLRIQIRDKQAPVARLAILDAPSRTAAHRAMKTRGLRIADTSKDGLKLTTKDSRGRPLDHQFQLPPVSETTVEFSL